MAFVVTETWTKSRMQAAADIMHAASYHLIPNGLYERIPNDLKRPIILILSASINAALLYAFITQSIISDDLINKNQERLVAIFDFSPENETEEKPTPEKQASNQDNISQQNQPIETSSLSIPKEWSVSRINIAQKNTSDNAGDDGNADDGVYDPYAGASPQLDQQKQADYTADYSNMDPAFDKSMFEAWIAKLRVRLRRANGTVMLSVTLDDGRIKDAQIIGGNASMPLRLFVRNDVMGQKLFNGGSGQKSLPEIRL